ncbi:hypothetical protein J6590_033723 [Homalodisca vitripennis]|nr:hypothetical protein J6590_033723 [Homalodisca vitripennis]
MMRESPKNKPIRDCLENNIHRGNRVTNGNAPTAKTRGETKEASWRQSPEATNSTSPLPGRHGEI